LTRSRPGWGERPPEPPHVWHTFGYRTLEYGDGRVVMEWDATVEYCFHGPGDSRIVHGGLVTTLLDTAMGGACWSVLEDGEDFLTADLGVEFMRSATPGTLRAEGRVVQRNRRVAFCSAGLFDAEGTLLAASRCTQIIRRST
jgi:uncharacterized protein (TIGR00369 family)